MASELSREDALRVSLGTIQSYAYEYGLSAENVEQIFNAGLAAAVYLNPGVFGFLTNVNKKAG